jgi:hypothetical protein
MLKRLHVKYLSFLSEFNELEFSRQIFEKKAQISSSFTFLLLGAELFHADERTDMTTLTVAFHNFVNSPHIYTVTGTEMCSPGSLNSGAVRYHEIEVPQAGSSFRKAREFDSDRMLRYKLAPTDTEKSDLLLQLGISFESSFYNLELSFNGNKSVQELT